MCSVITFLAAEGDKSANTDCNMKTICDNLQKLDSVQELDNAPWPGQAHIITPDSTADAKYLIQKNCRVTLYNFAKALKMSVG